jgi:quercetin dioxygenase-like cupin family protein
MRLVRGDDQPVERRPAPLPTIQRMVSAATGSTQLTVLVNQLDAGEQVGSHTHDFEEVLYVVTGRCQVAVDDETAALHAGDAVVIPAGAIHGFRHSGLSPATVVAVLASATVHTTWHEPSAHE